MPGFTPPRGLNPAKAEAKEHEIEFRSDVAANNMDALGTWPTTERPITVTLPEGATIRRVSLLAVIFTLNMGGAAQCSGITVQGRKGVGSWSNFYSVTEVLSVPSPICSMTTITAVSDVTSLVDEAEDYGFRVQITQAMDAIIRYITQFVLVITYRMS